MKTQSYETNPQQDDNILKVVLILICTIVFGYGVFFSRNTTSDLWFLIGLNLIYTLIIWGIFYLPIAMIRNAKINSLPFFAVFVSLIVSDLISYSRYKQEAKQMLSEIKTQYSESFKSSTDTQELPKQINNPIKLTPKPSGDLGEVLKVMKEITEQAISDRKDYSLELDAIGFDGLLDINRIKIDKTFAESKVIIQQAKQVVTKYTKKNQIALEDMKNKLLSLKISERNKNSLLIGFNSSGREEMIANISTLWSLEAKGINEIENIINFLSANKDAWVIDDKQILFYNDKDLERFNTYIASIQNIIQQEKEIQDKMIQTTNQKFDNMIKEME